MNLSKENMGLNLPMLLANHPPLESWHPSGPFSPPQVNDRSHQQMHVALPMPFSTPTHGDLNNTAKGSLGGGSVSGGGGSGTVVSGGPHSIFGGSSNSDFANSPQKPMDTTDIDNDKELESKCERTASTPSNVHETSIASNDGRLSSGPNGTPSAASDGGGGGGGGASGGAGTSSSGGGSGGSIGGGRLSAGASGTDAGSSPIPNTNTFEAHKQRHLIPGGALAGAPRDHDDLDIKQELLENYFHAPHPPPPPDSHRSYSSNEDRPGGEGPDDFAQDLRVSAAAAAAAKGLDFSRFVLPPSLRRSTDSIDEKFSPLNMRKLTASSASSSAAGQMLMNSLLSNESMSEDNNTSVSERLKPSGSVVGNPNGLGNSQDASSSAAAAAAAAAIYAESLNKDDCDFIGSNVSVKLRSMDRTQRIIAEKLISEVLYYGQFNELERSARIQPK